MGDVVRGERPSGTRGIPFGPNGNGSAGRRADVAPFDVTMGSIPVGRDTSPSDPEVLLIFTAGLPRAVSRALADLASNVPDDYTTPCRADPAAFDLPTVAAVNTPRFALQVKAIQDACDRCLDCRVFVQCMEVARQNAKEKRAVVTGILAGEVHGDDAGAAALRNALAPEGIAQSA